MSSLCPLCKDLGMVPSPGDWKENGGWEDCPMCYPPEPRKLGLLYRAWRRFLAFYRLDMEAVCEMSCDDRDYHDYPDSGHGEPFHFVTMKCKRCGKEFYI